MDEEGIITATGEAESDFTGGAFANYFIGLLTYIVSGLTLGIAFPFMMCWHERWVASHTYINGRQLRFDGTGGALFGKYIVWLLLSAVSLGFYAVIAMPVKLEAWKTENTHFADGEGGESSFTGWCGEFLGINMLAGFITLVTFSFGSYWAHCYKERWLAGHKMIDGKRLYFDGSAKQFFGKCIVWVLLTFVTFGIYSFWLTVKIKKWTVFHTHVIDADGSSTAHAPVEPKPKKPTNGFSVAGFVLSLFNLIPIALPLGIVGLKKSKSMDGSGKKLSVACIVMCCFWFLWDLMTVVLATTDIIPMIVQFIYGY